jgi:hypothetical protein
MTAGNFHFDKHGYKSIASREVFRKEFDRISIKIDLKSKKLTSSGLSSLILTVCVDLPSDWVQICRLNLTSVALVGDTNNNGQLRQL